MVTVADFIFLGSRITADSDYSHEIKRGLLFARKAMTNLDCVIKKQRHQFANKGSYNQNYVFSSNHVRIWKLGHKEGWMSKKWCFRVVVLKKTFGSPLDSKKLKPINPKGNWAWIFIRRTDAEAPILWPPDQRADSLERALMLGKIEGRRRGDNIVWHGWMASPTQGARVWTNSEWEIVKDRKVWRAEVHGVTKRWTWLSDRTQHM